MTQPHRRGFARRALRPVVLASLALVLVAGCSSGSGSSADDTPKEPVAPTITVTPAKGKKVSPTSKITVTADKGKLETVTVTSADGSVVPGKLSEADTVWRSDGELLQFGAKYKVNASAVGETRATTTSTFTVKETKGLRAFMSPDNRTVGVGMPIIVTLSATPDDRAEVERRLEVETSRPVTGAWHWFDDTELHWRPKEFWPANTDVEVRSDFKGVRFGKNTFGDHNTRVNFKIGKSTVTTVDIANHTMDVVTAGKLVRRIPVTNGNASFPTRSGIKVIISKEAETVMDSATVDIPEDSADAYRLKVKNAMRLTWSGEYVHAAPWSTASQGNRNVSHGCTGLSQAQSDWFYGYSQVGDVVKYINSNRPLEQRNGYTDWNLSWSDWLGGSALV
jgi:lipoprotein-anchoring transpeptidase ErfK/SrfK